MHRCVYVRLLHAWISCGSHYRLVAVLKLNVVVMDLVLAVGCSHVCMCACMSAAGSGATSRTPPQLFAVWKLKAGVAHWVLLVLGCAHVCACVQLD